METKLEIFFGKFAIYIIGFLLAASIVCGLGWYVSAVELDGQRQKTELVSTQLEVSNASYNSIKDQFGLLTKTLEANQEKALASHALLQEKLKTIMDSDKSRLTLENYLINRKPETQCATPEDLKNAWSKM